MARSVNKVTLIGRLGKDPELKYTASGSAYCRFSIATDDSWTDRSTGERQERTEWHNIVTWEKLAEICGQYLTKGKMVYIEGSIQSRQWEDQDGNKRTSFDIRARDMVMLGGPGGGGSGGGSGGGGSSPSSPPRAQEESPATDDDIPF
jgi:single-strand DNA-binding protein